MSQMFFVGEAYFSFRICKLGRIYVTLECWNSWMPAYFFLSLWAVFLWNCWQHLFVGKKITNLQEHKIDKKPSCLL